MSAPFIIPFDNNPSSTSIKTTAYTIPAGKYARVKNVLGDLTINGVDAFFTVRSFSRSYSATNGTTDIFPPENCDMLICVSSATVSNANNRTACGPLGVFLADAGAIGGGYFTNYHFMGQGKPGSIYTNATFTGTRTFYMAGSMYNGTANISTTGNVSISNTTPALLNYSGIAFYTERISGTVTHSAKAIKFSSDDIWVASGTVLDGGQYIVTEYNVIS